MSADKKAPAPKGRALYAQQMVKDAAQMREKVFGDLGRTNIVNLKELDDDVDMDADYDD